MDKAIKKQKFNLYILISLGLHGALLILPTQMPNLFEVRSWQKQFKEQTKNRKVPLKILSMKTVGKENAKHKNSVMLKQKNKSVQPSSHLKSNLSAKQLAPFFRGQKPPKKGAISKKSLVKDMPSKNPTFKRKTQLKRTGAIEGLSLSKKSINGFLKNSPYAMNARQFLNALGETSSIVKLEVPKGVKEDELNKHELVFYSFQKRTALNYINSFYKKLNQFELQNPHLNFPMTDKKQKMVGRVVYDKNGNIVRINVLKWTSIPKLQSFFMDVLKEMTSLPNPPVQILKDDQFTVFYALTIND